jgi:hypothetical protein
MATQSHTHAISTAMEAGTEIEMDIRMHRDSGDGGEDRDSGGVGLGIQVSLRDTSKLKDDFLMS